MKRFLLFLLLTGVFVTVDAQSRVALDKASRNLSAKVDYALQNAETCPQQIPGENPGLYSPVAFDESIVGTTRFDKQGNYIVGNRFWRYDDGRMNFVWTMGYNETTFPDRGTGYNKFDGTSWGSEPEFRLENTKTGWPSYAPLGANGEIVVTHLPDRLRVSRRATYGTGDWITQDLLGPAEAPKLTWPRVITTGPDHNIVHIICNTYDAYQGMERAMLYWRSSDGGETWDIQNELLPGTGPESYKHFTTDGYTFAAQGNNIAILAGSAFHDLFMLKSTDNGDNWTKTVIWENPYPFFDFEVTLTDTFYCADGGFGLAFDKDGMAHVTFGISRVLHDATGTTFSHFYLVDGIGYWNESRPVFSNNLKALCPYEDPESEMIQDFNLIGFSPDLNGNGEYDFVGQPTVYGSLGLSTMPTIHIDDEYRVYIAYATTTEGFNNGALDFKHVWIRTSPDNGTTWGELYDLMDNIVHIFDEGIMPQFPNTSDPDNLYVAINLDGEPGTAVDGDHSYVENSETIMKIIKDDVVGISPPIHLTQAMIPEIYPNPLEDNARISFELNQNCRVGISLMSVTGKKVFEKNFGTLTHGNHVLDIDVAGIASGTYMCILNYGNERVAKKIAIF